MIQAGPAAGELSGLRSRRGGTWRRRRGRRGTTGAPCAPGRPHPPQRRTAPPPPSPSRPPPPCGENKKGRRRAFDGIHSSTSMRTSHRHHTVSTRSSVGFAEALQKQSTTHTYCTPFCFQLLLRFLLLTDKELFFPYTHCFQRETVLSEKWLSC